jgi:hypothetical protein
MIVSFILVQILTMSMHFVYRWDEAFEELERNNYVHDKVEYIEWDRRHCRNVWRTYWSTLTIEIYWDTVVALTGVRAIQVPYELDSRGNRAKDEQEIVVWSHSMNHSLLSFECYVQMLDLYHWKEHVRILRNQHRVNKVLRNHWYLEDNERSN